MFNRIDKGLWWDRALTLVEGCTPVSSGCDNCWSAAMAHRFNKQELFYPDDPQYLPLTTCGKFNGNINCRPDRLDLPLKVKKPTAWAIWNDLFHEDVSFDFIQKSFHVFRESPQHLFLVLTKRPEIASSFARMFEMQVGHTTIFQSSWQVWPKNVLLGVTAENQKMADKRIQILRQITAAVKFISFEPLLSGIIVPDWSSISWAIVGCESGPHRREKTIP